MEGSWLSVFRRPEILVPVLTIPLTTCDRKEEQYVAFPGSSASFVVGTIHFSAPLDHILYRPGFLNPAESE
jgi:hypothetical protein